MKRFNRAATFIAALIGITMAASGCSKSNPSPVIGGIAGLPGSPGYGVGLTTPLPGGGAQVSFQGMSVYNSGIIISGGSVTGSANCQQYYCYCGYFSGTNGAQYGGYGYGGANVSSCWQFTNANHAMSGSGTGQTTVGSYGVPVGIGGSTTYNGASLVEPGATVTMVSSPTQEPLHANVTGTVTLPPAFVYRNFPQGVPPFVGIAFDFAPLSQGQITGGVLLYTSGNAQSGYHGAFLSIQ